MHHPRQRKQADLFLYITICWLMFIAFDLRVEANAQVVAFDLSSDSKRLAIAHKSGRVVEFAYSSGSKQSDRQTNAELISNVSFFSSSFILTVAKHRKYGPIIDALISDSVYCQCR